MAHYARLGINNTVVRVDIIDNSKIKNAVDFHPRYDIKTGLRKTISWYENN